MDIQPNLVGWRQLTGLELYFQGSHETYVVGSHKCGSPNKPAGLDKSPATTYEFMVALYPRTIANGVPSLAYETEVQPYSVSLFPDFSRN